MTNQSLVFSPVQWIWCHQRHSRRWRARRRGSSTGSRVSWCWRVAWSRDWAVLCLPSVCKSKYFCSITHWETTDQNCNVVTDWFSSVNFLTKTIILLLLSYLWRNIAAWLMSTQNILHETSLNKRLLDYIDTTVPSPHDINIITNRSCIYDAPEYFTTF